MKCPFCGKEENQVLESRVVEDGGGIRRRRKCEKCGKRFTTYEKVKDKFLWVVKKDGSREPFEKEKVKKGILRAVEKRPVSMDLVNNIIDRVEREMLKKGSEEISSKSIGQAVMRKLKTIDKVSWLRFASVYLEFEDLRDFAKAIKD